MPLAPGLNVTVNPFITAGLIVTLFVFLLTSAFTVEVPDSITVEGVAVTTRSIRGSVSAVPAPVATVSHGAAVGNASHPHQLFSPLTAPLLTYNPLPVMPVLPAKRQRFTFIEPTLL
jgi:hypothetical protein